MTPTGARLPHWRCRLLRWHDWVARSTEDGGRYTTCARCGRDQGVVGYRPVIPG